MSEIIDLIGTITLDRVLVDTLLYLLVHPEMENLGSTCIKVSEQMLLSLSVKNKVIEINVDQTFNVAEVKEDFVMVSEVYLL